MGSGFGAGAGADMLQEILRDKFAQALAMRQQNLAAQRQQEQSAYQREALASLQEDRNAKQQAARALGASRIAGQIAPGAQLDAPTVDALSQGGLGALVQHKDATLGSTNYSGAVNSGAKAPRIIGLAKSANPGQDAKDLFTGTADQMQADQVRKDRAAQIEQARQDKMDAAAQGKTDKEDLIKLTASMRPAPAGHFSLQPGTGPDGKPVMYRVNAQTGEASIVDTHGGALGKGDKVNATTENRLQSAKAVVQTGEDITRALSDPKIAAQLGQAMSRYNSVADFVGNAPPEWSNLAGMIESYSLANMGVHGMRSASGAEAIKQTLGQGRHTPESMIAALKGLNGFSNHLLENNGRGAAPPAPGAAPAASEAAARAAELVKKYGGS